MPVVGSRVGDVTNAAVDALRGDSTLTTLLGGSSKVYTHVPETTTAPYVVVTGGLEQAWSPAFGADDPGRQVDVTVLVVSGYRGTWEVDGLMAQVLTRLLTEASWSGVSGFAAVQFVTNAAPTIEIVNGVVYYSRLGTVRVLVA